MTQQDDKTGQAKTPIDEAPDLLQVLGAARAGKAKSRRFSYGLTVLLIAAGAAGYYYYQSAGARPLYSYETQEIKRGDLSVIVTATGSVQPTEQVDISSELSGTVRKVHVTYNSPVKAGDVLAELDTNKLEADMQSARAKLASAKANVLKAQAELGSATASLERLKSLVLGRVSSQKDLDTAQFAYHSATATLQVSEAAVLSAEADLRLVQVNYGKTKIISPIDAIILKRAVDPGATVASSLNAPVLFTIAGDLRRMELQVAVDEAEVGKIAAGQPASFNVDAYPDHNFPAKIEAVRFAPETVANVVTYKAVLSVDNDKLLLRPGMTATANIVVQSVKGAVMVPNAALRYAPPREASARAGASLMALLRPPRFNRPRERGPDPDAAGKRTLWVLRNDVPAAVSVALGASDGRFTAVTSGDLAPGDLIITGAVAYNG